MERHQWRKAWRSGLQGGCGRGQCLGVAKPDPRAFELACGRLGLPPQAAVYVGDQLSCGLPRARHRFTLRSGGFSTAIAPSAVRALPRHLRAISPRESPQDPALPTTGRIGSCGCRGRLRKVCFVTRNRVFAPGPRSSMRAENWTPDSSTSSHCLPAHAAPWADNSAVRLQGVGTGDRDVSDFSSRRAQTTQATMPSMRSMPP